MACFIGAAEIPCSAWGTKDNSQVGSQWWLNSDYTGMEPDYATKALYSDAQYAHDLIPSLVANLNLDTSLYSPAIQETLAEPFPTAGNSSGILIAAAAIIGGIVLLGAMK